MSIASLIQTIPQMQKVIIQVSEKLLPKVANQLKETDEKIVRVYALISSCCIILNAIEGTIHDSKKEKFSLEVQAFAQVIRPLVQKGLVRIKKDNISNELAEYLWRIVSFVLKLDRKEIFFNLYEMKTDCSRLGLRQTGLNYFF